jgi:hypothetical protein
MRARHSAIFALVACAVGVSGGGNATYLNQITGAGVNTPLNIKADVGGADLGIVFEHDGAVLLVFGDTFGYPTKTEPKPHWRSNTMAVAAVDPQSRAVTATAWVTGADGTARELVGSAHDPSGNSEVSCIPTAAWSDGTTVYLVRRTVCDCGRACGCAWRQRCVLVSLQWYMSVIIFQGDTWACNNASIATSSSSNIFDATYTKQQTRVAWAGSSPFLMFAVATFDSSDAACGVDAGFLYLFATPCGREGAARLLRVPQGSVLQQGSYEYFSGSPSAPAWSASEASATVVLPGQVGELSVSWLSARRQWVAIHAAPGSLVVARTAPCLWGPWTPSPAADVLISAAPYDGAYGGYTHPALMSPTGNVAFMASFWDEYGVKTYSYNATST